MSLHLRSAIHLASLGLVLVPDGVGAQPAKTMVLPLRTVDVSDVTAVVSRDILEHELQARDVEIIPLRSLTEHPIVGPDACDHADCVQALGREAGADQVVYGSLSRLGNEILVRIHVLRVGESTPFYREQLSATHEKELDTIMLRIAEGISSGKADSDQASIDSVTLEEMQTPRRRATRRGFSAQSGLLL